MAFKEEENGANSAVTLVEHRIRKVHLLATVCARGTHDSQWL